MVKKLSDSIALYLSCEMSYDQDKKEILSYGLQIVIGGFFKIITLLSLSYLLGIFSYTMVGMLSFSAFRTIIGGVHQDTYAKCFVTSISMLIMIGFIGKHLYFVSAHNLTAAWIVLGFALIVTIIWVPAGTEKKEIKNKKTRLIMKIKALGLLLIWVILLVLSTRYHYQYYAFSSISGVFFTFFLVTPPAYMMFQSKFIPRRG